MGFLSFVVFLGTDFRRLADNKRFNSSLWIQTWKLYRADVYRNQSIKNL